MEKYRKVKNVANEEQTYSDLETEIQIETAPESFLTSENFCIVQKKKKTSKNTQDSVHAQSDLFKHVNTEEGNEKTVNETCNSDNITDSSLACNSVNSNNELFKNEGFVNSSNKFKNGVNLDGISICDILTNGVSVPKTEDVLENHSTLNNSKCTTKKEKKKGYKNKLEELEVQKLLKELGLTEDNSDDHILNNNKTCAKNKKLNNYVINDDKTSHKTVKNAKSSNLLDVEKECNYSVNFGKINVDVDLHKPVANNREDKVSAEVNVIKSASQKKKEKRLNAKLKKNGENDVKDLAKECEAQNTKDTLASGDNEKTAKERSVEISENKSRKRPSKKQLAIIQEAVRKAKEEEERLKKEEEAKKRLAEEAERIKQEKLRLEEEKKEKKKLKEKQRKEKMKAEGRYLTKSQKQARARMEATLAALKQQGINVPEICEKKTTDNHGPRLGNCKNFHRKRVDSSRSVQSSDSAIVISERQKTESLSSQESSGKDSLISDLPSSFDSTEELVLPESEKGNFSCSEESDVIEETISEIALSISKATDLLKTSTVTEKTSNKSDMLPKLKPALTCNETNSVKLRSPVVCVLGHVDTGKTKILDYIRKTHVQNSEAGGITQQIGATMIPSDALKEKCKMVKDFSLMDIKIPGLLVIDTPGHESFSNLRFRGSSICDIAILVVDIMHGLEPQTVESINLLKRGKTPFVVALNKVDRIYGWKSNSNEDIQNTIMNQSQTTQMEFKRLVQEIILQFANHCLNASLFYENKDPRSYVSMIPTSAISGDGMGNMLSTITQLTQSIMHRKLIYTNELEATVLEVKAISGLGTTIDVILVNGELHEGDTIVLAGQDGPIVTQIRSLLMPQPLKELRVKNPYIEYKAIKGAQGVKITGKDLDKSIAGLPLFVAQNHSMIDNLKEEVNYLLGETISSIKTSERGVYVQASTLGSLEALLNFLTSSNIPYFNVKIGPVVKKDVVKASVMLEHDAQYAVILAFDVKIERDAQELADSLGVHIFHADIIYHLFDMYMEFRDNLLLKRKEDIKRLAVFPCKLKILSEFTYTVRDPITLGVYIEDGILREGTPLCIPSRNCLDIGTVSSIELNGNKVECAKKGDEVFIRIDSKSCDSSKTFGKQFNHEDLIISRITRQSIDICKEYFRDELQSNDWHLMVELKKILHIV